MNEEILAALRQLQAEFSQFRTEIQAELEQTRAGMSRASGEVMRARTAVEQIKSDISRQFDALEVSLDERAGTDPELVERIAALCEEVDELRDELYIVKSIVKSYDKRLRRPSDKPED